MTGKQKIINALFDGQWHSYLELLNVYYKYTQRIYDLRCEGYFIDERPNQHNKHALDYRLVKTPAERNFPDDRFPHENHEKKEISWEKRVEAAKKIVINQIQPKEQQPDFGF